MTSAVADSSPPVRASTHSWPRRPLAAAERARLRREVRLTPLKVALGLLPAVLAALLGWGVGTLVEWALTLFDLGVEGMSLVGLVILGAVGWAASALLALQYLRASRPYLDDLRAGEAQVIDAQVSRCADVGCPDVPALVLELGGRGLCFLAGSWIRERASSTAFPAAELMLVRAPASGVVLAIETRGAAVPIEDHAAAGPGTCPAVVGRESELFDGTLDELVAYVDAHRRPASLRERRAPG